MLYLMFHSRASADEEAIAVAKPKHCCEVKGEMEEILQIVLVYSCDKTYERANCSLFRPVPSLLLRDDLASVATLLPIVRKRLNRKWLQLDWLRHFRHLSLYSRLYRGSRCLRCCRCGLFQLSSFVSVVRFRVILRLRCCDRCSAVGCS